MEITEYTLKQISDENKRNHMEIIKNVQDSIQGELQIDTIKSIYTNFIKKTIPFLLVLKKLINPFL